MSQALQESALVELMCYCLHRQLTDSLLWLIQLWSQALKHAWLPGLKIALLPYTAAMHRCHTLPV